VSTFHLHARLFEGRLDAPTRNELLTDEADDLTELEHRGRSLLGRGFTVWIYAHGPHRVVAEDGPYRVIKQWRPENGHEPVDDADPEDPAVTEWRRPTP
jgi:hypothetical protein